MVPLRAVAEALGLTVTWHHSGSTVDLIHGDWTPSLAGRTIVVDPGHGGSATGAVYEGVKESALNLAIAQKTAAALEAPGGQGGPHPKRGTRTSPSTPAPSSPAATRRTSFSASTATPAPPTGRPPASTPPIRAAAASPWPWRTFCARHGGRHRRRRHGDPRPLGPCRAADGQDACVPGGVRLYEHPLGAAIAPGPVLPGPSGPRASPGAPPSTWRRSGAAEGLSPHPTAGEDRPSARPPPPLCGPCTAPRAPA